MSEREWEREVGAMEGNIRGIVIYFKKNTIRDGCSTALYTADTVDTFDTVYTIQPTLCYLNNSLYAYIYIVREGLT